VTASVDLPPHTRLHTDPHGFAVAIPRFWDVVTDVDATTVLAAVEPESAGTSTVGFRANLVVTRDEGVGLDLDTWQKGTDLILDRTLTGWVLLDLERLEINGLPAARRLGTYVAPDGPPVTLEQWVVLRGEEGLTLSMTAATATWDTMADEVAAIGATFNVEGSCS
jgi:hypothetical protein